MLAAGFAGTALGLLGGRVASATTPPTDGTGTTAPTGGDEVSTPPQRPTGTDFALLNYAQSIELAARDLYQSTLDAGATEPLVGTLRNQHQAFSDILRGILGTRSIERRNPGVFQQFSGDFATTDVNAGALAAYQLESAFVATYTELVGRLEGTDGARLIGSILVAEARQAAILADVAGRGDDFDEVFNDNVPALSIDTSGGG